MNTETSNIRLLVVEDESHLAAGIKLNLELEGFSVDVAETGRRAAEFLATTETYGVILLDGMLPDVDGFDLCARIRESGNFTPILMLTVRNSPADRVRGLEAGADDYVTKPFDLSELLARIRSLLRRRNWESESAMPRSTTLAFGGARVDFQRLEAEMNGEPRQLTQLEFALLRYFAEHPGEVISRDELLREVWRIEGAPNTRTVDNFVLRLRKYFEPNPSNPVHFVSVRGRGYRFCPLFESA